MNMSSEEFQRVNLKQDWVEEEASSRRTCLGVVAQALPDEVLLKGVLELWVVKRSK